MAPKNQPKRKGLVAPARFGLRYEFDQEELDPVNAPELAKQFALFQKIFHGWVDAPNGLRAEFDEIAQELREAFAEKNPRLRVRYAKALKPLDEVTH